MSLPFSLKGNLNEFMHQYSIEEDNETKAFEHFVNYLIISKYSPDAINDTNATILAKVEYFNPASSVKDRTALAMIEGAIKDGLRHQMLMNI